MPLDLKPKWLSPVSRRCLYRPLVESTLKAPGKKALRVKGAWIMIFNRYNCTLQEVEDKARSTGKCISSHILCHIKLVTIIRFCSAKPELDPHVLTIGNVWTLLIENKVLLYLQMLETVVGEIKWVEAWELWVGGSLNTGLDTAKLQVTS